MKEQLLEQLQRTMEHAKMEHYYMKDKALQMIVERYEHAIQVLNQQRERTLSSEDFCIWGSIPIYLSALQDFTNPLIPELSKSETMLNDYMRISKK